MAIAANMLVTPCKPITGSALLTTANTNYSAPTVTVELLPVQTDGARLHMVQVAYGATAVAHDCQLYAYDGINKRFLRAKAVAAKTLSAGGTVAIDPIDFGYNDTTNPLVLKAGEGLHMAISVTNTAMLGRCEGGAYGTPS